MSRHKSFLLLILTIAFVLRAVAAIGLDHYLKNTAHRQFLIAGDATGYWELAKRIASGQEYSVYEPPRQVMRTPGFSALLALPISLAGESTLAARLVLAAVGTLACWLVYLLGVAVFDANVGVIAAGLTAFSPTMAGFSVLILSETLFAASLVASLVVMAHLTKPQACSPLKKGSDSLEGVRNKTKTGRPERVRPLFQRTASSSIWLAALAGIIFATACYVRPSWILAIPLCAALLVLLSKDRKRAAIQAVAIVTTFIAAWTPWVIRNHQATGQFVVTTLWVGPSLYDGLNPEANGDSNMTFFERENVMATISEYEMDQHYRQRAVDFVRNNPSRTVQLVGLKLIRYWKPWPNADQFNSAWHKLAVSAFFVPLIAGAVWGTWINRKQPWTWLVTIAPIIYFSAIHSVFVGSLRYRLPAEYPMCVMAAAAICEGIRRRKRPVPI